MHMLENRVPPPLVGLIFAGLMWSLRLTPPVIDWPLRWRIAAAVMVASAGVGFSLAGVLSFRRAKTTVNPLKPETASALVVRGVYRVSRNPMYVGMLLVLLAWALYLSSPWTLLGPVAFVAYITRFQIVPEERALAARFGASFAHYCAKVRRWL